MGTARTAPACLLACKQGQATWRVADELLEQVLRQAKSHGRSLNDWVTTVLASASDSAHAADETAQVRERLSRAGLLEQVSGQAPRRPDAGRVKAARARAGAGRPLSELVTEQCR